MNFLKILSAGILLTAATQLHAQATEQKKPDNPPKCANIKEGKFTRPNYPEAIWYMTIKDNVQTEYFNTIDSSYEPSKAILELKNVAIDEALSSLKGAGITANITEKLQSILRTNVNTGASYVDLMKQMREYLISNESGQGALEKYTKQITTDTLNQYAAQYNTLVSNDLGLKWYRYTGALIATSRPFCEACKKKQFIYEAELNDIIAGNFPEFDEFGGKIDSRTGLPSGMIPSTNKDNFKVYRGGYNCNHQAIPISETIVPKSIRIQVYTKYGIKFDENGFALAA